MLDRIRSDRRHGILWHGRRARTAAACLAILSLSGQSLISCNQIPRPVPTAVNPETFPQPTPPISAAVPSELPPPVTENRTFVTIEGIPQYKIGPGDLLDVFITKGSTQERVQVPVRANGRVSVSYAEVRVDGLTADQAAAELTRALAVYFRNPQVEVQVKEYNSKKASVFGAVGGAPRGGISSVSLTGRTTLLELIAKAGGLAPSASLERVRITRESGKAYTVNMYRYIQEGDLSQEFILDSGDIVFVPERVPGEESRVYLLGEVKNPGPVPYFPSMTLGQLVAQVGGWTDGALFEEARIIRGDPNKPEIISVDLNRLVIEGDRRIDQVLRPNDVVFLPRTRIADWNAFVAQLRPTLEFIVLGLQPYVIYRTIK